MTRGPTIVNKQIKASRKIESYIQPYRALERDTTRHEIQIYIYITTKTIKFNHRVVTPAGCSQNMVVRVLFWYWRLFA